MIVVVVCARGATIAASVVLRGLVRLLGVVMGLVVVQVMWVVLHRPEHWPQIQRRGRRKWRCRRVHDALGWGTLSVLFVT